VLAGEHGRYGAMSLRRSRRVSNTPEEEAQHLIEEAGDKLYREKQQQDTSNARCSASVDMMIREGDVSGIAKRCVGNEGLGLDTGLRSTAWKLLLENDAFKLEAEKSCKQRSKEAIAKEIQMDIDRSYCHFNCCKELNNATRLKRRKDLSELICSVLHANPELHYYQGFHDVATVFLHIYGSPQKALIPLQQMCHQVFADHHRRDFSTTIEVMNMLPIIIRHFDQEVGVLFEETECGPLFALSWVITGFAHSVSDIRVVMQIYDALLVNHPAFVVYLCAALVLRPTTKMRLFEASDGSMPSVHHFLQNVAPPRMKGPRSSRKRQKKRSRRLRALREQQMVNASNGVVLSRDEYVPTTKAEEDENLVTALVRKGLEMMHYFPPERVCNVMRRLESEVPEESLVHLPTTKKQVWIDVSDMVAEALPNKKLYQDVPIRRYVTVAAAVGVALLATYASRGKSFGMFGSS